MLRPAASFFTLLSRFVPSGCLCSFINGAARSWGLPGWLRPTWAGEWDGERQMPNPRTLVPAVPESRSFAPLLRSWPLRPGSPCHLHEGPQLRGPLSTLSKLLKHPDSRKRPANGPTPGLCAAPRKATGSACSSQPHGRGRSQRVRPPTHPRGTSRTLPACRGASLVGAQRRVRHAMRVHPRAGSVSEPHGHER